MENQMALIKRAKAKRTVQLTIIVLVILIMTVLFLFPLYLAFVSAFKTKAELSKSVLSLPASFRYLENFKEGLKTIDFTRAFTNTTICTFPSVVLVVICSSLGGYAIARHGRYSRIIKSLDTIYLASLMIPFQILMIPVYKLYKNMSLLNSLWGMILMLTGISIAYSTFLYVGFCKSVPEELENAALIDGCGPFRAFFSVVFPLLTPITATVAALHIMWFWNDFNVAIILLQRETVRTLTVKQFYFFGQYRADYGMAFAASLVSMIPVIVFFSMMQRYIVDGIAAGAVKS